MNMPRAERVARVQKALLLAGLSDVVVPLQDNTATTAAAAAVLGCSQGEIAKSLMFRTHDNRPILAVLAGDRRVCANKLSQVAGDVVVKANANFVKAATGYEIGGVPPLAHPPEVRVVVDVDLQRYETVWAAAGSAHAVFSANPVALARAAGAQIADIAETPPAK